MHFYHLCMRAALFVDQETHFSDFKEIREKESKQKINCCSILTMELNLLEYLWETKFFLLL